MISEDYVSFEVAKLLKEKGFDEPFYFFYRTDDKMLHHVVKAKPLVYGNNIDDEVISAPTHQRVMKWLREIHKVNIEIHYNRFGEIYKYLIIYKPEVLNDIRSLGVYYSYEEACEAAIKYCLEILI